MIITITDVRRHLLCCRGAKRFFKVHELDWEDFLKNGIEADKLIATGDSMAIKVVEECSHGRR